MKRLTLLTTVLVVFLMVVSCGPKPAPTQVPEAPTEAPKVEPTSPPPPAPEEVSTLILGVEGSPPTFDPLGAGLDSVIDTPTINLYNALIQVKPGTTELELELAESYETSDDGLAYTFKLRQGVKFHDGSELKAEDVKYTVDRMLTLKKGVYGTLSAISGAEVVDDYTVVLRLESLFSGLLDALCRLYILNADVVKEHEQDGDWGEAWLVDQEAGSGPYVLVSWEREQQYVAEKFPDYFKGWEGKHADRVVFRIFKDQSTRRLAVEEGDVDWTLIFDVDIWKGLEDVPGVRLHSDPALIQAYIAFNQNVEYLKDVRIRRALSLVYDRKGHVEIVRSGHSAIARGPLPPAIPCFDDSIPPEEYNIEKAKELMAEAGYPDGGFELTMAYQGTFPEEVSIMELMQAGAAEIGITVKPVAVEWSAKVDLFSAPETAPDIGTIWVYPNAPLADEYLFQLGHTSRIGAGGVNFAYYSNPQFDELVEAGRTELDLD